MRSSLKSQANIAASANTSSPPKLKPFFHRLLQKTYIYLIDAHSTDGFHFRRQSRRNGNFQYLGSLNYRDYKDKNNKDCEGLYRKKGWEWERLSSTGFQPLLTEKEAEAQWKNIVAGIEASKPGARLGIEGADCLLTVKNARELALLAQKREVLLKVQLTYNHQNQLATGCLAWDKESGAYVETGLSEVGEKVARELMKGGVIIDVSHLNEQSALDVCRIGMEKDVRKPVIASHSNSRAVFVQGMSKDELRAANLAVRRCISDDEIKAILETGGYIGLTFYPPFLGKPGSDLLRLWADHINHVRSLAGDNRQKAVALASDVDRGNDGAVKLPPGYDNESSYKRIFSYLLRALERRKWPPDDIEALFHGNVERVFHLKE